MKSSLSSKLRVKRLYLQIAVLAAFLAMLIWGCAEQTHSPGSIRRDLKKTSYEPKAAKPEVAATPQNTLNTVRPISQPPPSVSFSHESVTTTVFWVGELANADNGGISNAVSTWDNQWQQHFGGFDDPEHRNGYLPAGFVPAENVFYFALPYSDLDDEDHRKPNALNSPLYTAMKDQPYSWCKNAWIAIRHDGKTAYAQWEDAGPFGEDDAAYVFGDSPPANNRGVKAALDVSPAVRDYLGLDDVDSCDWGFVPADNVPEGPWKQITTITPGKTINN